jgi:outer membrane protein assembly factor BamB
MAQVDLATGRQRWLAEVSPLAHSFEPVGGTGYALTPYGDLYAVNISNGETEVVMSLEPPEIGGTTYRHLVSDGDILILTPGNNQAFAFAIP